MLSIVWGAIYLQPRTSKPQICIIHLFSEYHSRSDNILQKQSSPARLQVETWPHRFCQNIKTKLILQITIHHFELIDITNAQVFILYKLRQRYFRCTWFEVGRPVNYTFWLVHLWGFYSCFNCFTLTEFSQWVLSLFDHEMFLGEIKIRWSFQSGKVEEREAMQASHWVRSQRRCPLPPAHCCE